MRTLFSRIFHDCGNTVYDALIYISVQKHYCTKKKWTHVNTQLNSSGCFNKNNPLYIHTFSHWFIYCFDTFQTNSIASQCKMSRTHRRIHQTHAGRLYVNPLFDCGQFSTWHTVLWTTQSHTYTKLISVSDDNISICIQYFFFVFFCLAFSHTYDWVQMKIARPKPSWQVQKGIGSHSRAKRISCPRKSTFVGTSDEHSYGFNTGPSLCSSCPFHWVTSSLGDESTVHDVSLRDDKGPKSIMTSVCSQSGRSKPKNMVNGPLVFVTSTAIIFKERLSQLTVYSVLVVLYQYT